MMSRQKKVIMQRVPIAYVGPISKDKRTMLSSSRMLKIFILINFWVQCMYLFKEVPALTLYIRIDVPLGSFAVFILLWVISEYTRK